ncbi:MAG: PorP/SprF family type IX secretion system membrane protein [Bacteroidales bacterium]|nr:PorP/SprF family type IX secretion system membrane protein [Bacteroidales bacterium]
MLTGLSKKAVILLIAVSFASICRSQQEAQFTQFMFNRLSWNPASAGSNGSMCATLLYRNQWMGLQLDPPIQGAQAGSTPVTYLFSFESPVKPLHGGLGVLFFMDNIGYNSSKVVLLDYAFRMYWGKGDLSVGVEAGARIQSLDYKYLFGYNDFTGNPQNPTQPSQDPLLSGRNGEKDATIIDASVGMLYQVPHVFHFEWSLKNLLAGANKDINFKNARILNLGAGYEYVLPSNPSFHLRPYALFKSADFNLHTWQLDVACLLEYQAAFWGGVSYRVNDAVSFLFGVNAKKFRIGASYDITTSQLGVYKDGRSNGTVELYLRYCFKVIVPPKPPSIYRNTRYID